MIQSFAPPALTLYATRTYAILRADPGREPIVTAVSEIGTERFRSQPAIPLGGAAYAVLMIAGEGDFAEVYQPSEGESVVVRADEEVILNERAPRVLASIDRPGAELWGLAPPRARILAQIDNRSGVVSADEDGDSSFNITNLTVERDTVATVLTYPGESLARVYEIEVPDFEWQADVLADAVIGRGPAGFPLAIVAYARDMAVRRPDVSITQGVIGPRGVWGLGFGGFDLRAGDDLELYLFDAEKFLWWSEDAIAGPIEPTPVPTAMPTVIPTDTPEPTPTDAPENWTLYLPRAEQS